MTDHGTQPADLLAPLLALVDKWREDANKIDAHTKWRGIDAHTTAPHGLTWNHGACDALRSSADELQAAIESLAAHRGEVSVRSFTGRVETVDGFRCVLLPNADWLDDSLVQVTLKSLPTRSAHPPQAQSGAGDAEMARIGELIRTQDNRITDQPIFIVQQKRRICGVDEDYAEDFMWYDARAVESYDEAGKAERDADREAEGLPPIEWQRGGYIDTWEFVTACFTEQGCKDYIARDGHNLREPRIYAYGSYRNEEFRAVRKYLAALEAIHEPE